MDIVLNIFDIALTVVMVMMCYRYLYLIVGFFGKAKKYPEAKQEHRYAVVICARNEEKVIGNLLDSIAAQRYPKDKLHVFVIADNCTDATAAIAREKGATVYERHDPEHARKGWALGFGFDKIREEFGIDFVDGYMIFDADNLLHPDFVKEMNKAFDEGKLDVITGYRNTKNFRRIRHPFLPQFAQLAPRAADFPHLYPPCGHGLRRPFQVAGRRVEVVLPDGRHAVYL